jgi:hypothetical protein
MTNTVDELISQLQVISRNGYGDNKIIDYENQDYELTGFNISEFEYDDESIEECVFFYTDEIVEGNDK